MTEEPLDRGGEVGDEVEVIDAGVAQGRELVATAAGLYENGLHADGLRGEDVGHGVAHEVAGREVDIPIAGRGQ